jgi:branched-subunit amino acid transport protein
MAGAKGVPDMSLTDHDLYILAAIALLTVCSVLTRSIYFALGHHLPLPESVRQALRYAPVAALVAIIVPELWPSGIGLSGVLNVKFGAAVIAVLVFLRTRNTLLVILGGMFAFWVLRALAVFF